MDKHMINSQREHIDLLREILDGLNAEKSVTPYSRQRSQSNEDDVNKRFEDLNSDIETIHESLDIIMDDISKLSSSSSGTYLKTILIKCYEHLGRLTHKEKLFGIFHFLII